MEWRSAPLDVPESIAATYQAESRALLSRRVPIGVGLFLLAMGLGTLLEWHYYPARSEAALLAYAAYVLVCAAQMIALRRRQDSTFLVTELAVNALPLGLSAYFGAVHSNADLLVLNLIIFVTGVAILYPWGARGQLMASVGTLVGYVLALALGATANMPVPYEVLCLLTAVLVAMLGAHLLDGQRFSTHVHQARLQAEQRFSEALLQVGRAVTAAISDPQALADQLAEQTRVALGADWAFVLQKGWDDIPVFRPTAFSHAPAKVAEEIHALDLSPKGMGLLYRLLDESDLVELKPGPGFRTPLPGLFERWNLSMTVFQAIRREQELIGVLGCCYTAPHQSVEPAERRLMAAIANQAVVALENARLMEEARGSNRLKSEFVAAVSHELRTPLSVILGYTDMLLDAAADGSMGTPRDLLLRVRQQSLELLELIQAMLDLNRLETRRLPIAIEALTLGELIARVRSNLPATWSKDGVRLQWDVRGLETVLHSDRGKVETILRNLIHNALKYTDTGSVTVTVEPLLTERRVRFTVADTGPGVASEEQEAIFEMFRQGSSRPSRGGGVGLGLYIVKRFTEVLGGQVSVESQEGAGARFTVSFPLDVESRVSDRSVVNG